MVEKYPLFLIHQHDAERVGLHHDLRLEQNGVLVSWAIPKLMPGSSDKRRLAIKMPDHPMESATFEGQSIGMLRIIEEGYGKGTVEIWDEGYYIPINITDNMYFIQFRGEKIGGNYYIKHWEGKNWLIWKQK